MNRLKIKCKPLDDLLGGGIEQGTITELYGEAGSGKTNYCLQASRACVLKGKKVAYVDTEGVSLERLEQICPSHGKKKILSNILFFSPTTFEEQEAMVQNATKINDVGLIVLDTFNMFYRIQLDKDEKGANRSLNRQITKLQVEARKNGVYVLITGQVYTVENDDVKPFAGKIVEHMAKIILKFEKTGMGKRRASIIKHRSFPEGKSASFRITSDGLE